MQNKFLKQLRLEFADLIEDGVLDLHAEYVDADFPGDATVTFSGSGFMLRVLRYRRDVSAKVCAVDAEEEWVPLSRALHAVGVDLSAEPKLWKLDELARVISEYHEDLSAGYTGANLKRTKKHLRKLTEAARRRAMDRFRRK